MLIARKDKVAYFKAFGFRDREQKIAMTPDSIFRIASITKPIVSVGVMMLAEEGKLDIAAPVSNYLPEFKDLKVSVEQVDPTTGKKETVMQPQMRPMTVQDLLRHTDGLVYPPPIGNGPVSDAYRDVNVFDRNATLAEMMTKISKLPLAHRPGEGAPIRRALMIACSARAGDMLDSFAPDFIASHAAPPGWPPPRGTCGASRTPVSDFRF